MMTPSQIRAGDGGAPDPRKEKVEWVKAQRKARVAGHQALPSRRREEANRELQTQPHRHGRGRAVRLELSDTQKQGSVRVPTSWSGKAAMRKPRRSHRTPAENDQAMRSPISRRWTLTGGDRESTWSGETDNGKSCRLGNHTTLQCGTRCTVSHWRFT